MLTPIAMYLYHNRNDRQMRNSNNGAGIGAVIFFIFALWAGWLSWTSNKKVADMSGFKHVIYALAAALDNFTYILNFYIFKRNVAQ